MKEEEGVEDAGGKEAWGWGVRTCSYYTDPTSHTTHTPHTYHTHTTHIPHTHHTHTTHTPHTYHTHITHILHTTTPHTPHHHPTQVYFDYLERWVQVSTGHILEEEWKHVKEICTHIHGGKAETGRRFW